MGASRDAEWGMPADGIRPKVSLYAPPGLLLGIWWLLAIGALLLRSTTLGESLWLDELHTSWAVQGSFAEVAQRAADGNQGPIYFWMVWLLTQVAGHSEVTLRLVSLIAGSGLVFAASRLSARWIRSPVLATLVGALVAIDPHCVFFSREARPYALVQLLVVVQLMAFTARLAEARFSRPGWIVTTVLLFYTHYTATLVIVAELAFLFVPPWWRRLQKPTVFRAWLVDLLVCVLFMSLASSHLLQVAGRRDNWSVFVRVPNRMALLNLFDFVPYLIVPTALAACLYASRVNWRATRNLQGLRSVGWLIIFWYLFPAGLAWLVSRWEVAPLFFRRYLIGTGVAWLMYAAWCGSRIAPVLPRLLFAIAVLLFAAFYHFRNAEGNYLRHSKEDWRAAVQYLRASDEAAATTVWLRPGLIEDSAVNKDVDERFQAYCQFPVRGIYAISQSFRQVEILSRDWSRWSDDQWARIAREPRGLVLARGDASTLERVESQLIDATNARGGVFHIDREESFPGLMLIEFHVQIQ